jgi:S1-C subfamily serine protease
LGTGVIYSASSSIAYVITCNHVIQRDDGSAAKRIRVTLPSGSTVTATLIGRSPTKDIAVLKVKARGLKQASFFTDISEVERGDFVVAVGKVKELKHPIVSGNVLGFADNVSFPQLPEIDVDNVIESSAPLEEGDSGGPLVNVLGQVIGINMGKPEEGQGGVSLPADQVVQIAKQLIAAAK